MAEITNGRLAMPFYIGTIVEESLKDNRVLNDFHIANVHITDEDDPAKRWHLYKVEATREQLDFVVA